MTTPKPCGCRVVAKGLDLERTWLHRDDVDIHYCPTHAAAADLLAALRRIDEHVRAFPERRLDEGCVQAVRTAIANAEEEGAEGP